MKFIIYGLVDPRTDEVRYIGQSSRGMQRAVDHGIACHLRHDKTHKGKWIRSLVRSGLTYRVTILEVVEEKSQLNAAEIKWIAQGRSRNWRLTNHTDGGEGLKNPIPSTRAKLTANNRRRNSIAALQTPEARAKAKSKMTGRAKTESEKANMSAAALARFADPVKRAVYDAAMASRKRPIPRSDEHRRKLSQALKGKPRPYMAARNRTMVWTDEMRARQSAKRSAGPVNCRTVAVANAQGVKHSIAEWSRLERVSYSLIRYRIVDLGWTLEKAVSEPRRGVITP